MASRSTLPENSAADLARKVRRHLLPMLFLLYVVAYLDRINVGFAALDMNRELGLSSEQYGLLSGIFFCGYFLFEIPSNLILHRTRCPHLDRSHSADMGPGRDADRFRAERTATLCGALFTRRRGGRILSRNPVLPVLLVSPAATGPGGRIVPDGTADCEHPRRSVVGLDHWTMCTVLGWRLAVALDSRSAAGHRLWTSDISSSSRPSGRRVFSHRRRKGADPRRARGRGSRQAQMGDSLPYSNRLPILAFCISRRFTSCF